MSDAVQEQGAGAVPIRQTPADSGPVGPRERQEAPDQGAPQEGAQAQEVDPLGHAGELPIVEVDWVDSTGQEGWVEAAAVDELPTKMGCRAAGYIVVDEPAYIVLALGHGGFGGYLTPMAIPRVAIRSMRRLYDPPRPG